MMPLQQHIPPLPPQSFVDPGDICNACRGRGGASYSYDSRTRVWEPCWLCGGSGASTVKVSA